MSKKTLRQIRRERDITQEELSKKTGLSDRIISLYENDIEVLRGASYYNLEKNSECTRCKNCRYFLG